MPLRRSISTALVFAFLAVPGLACGDDLHEEVPLEILRSPRLLKLRDARGWTDGAVLDSHSGWQKRLKGIDSAATQRREQP